MNKEKQRVAIAEICDRIYSYYHTDKGFLYGSNEGQVGRFKIPDYLNDLNSMHEAVMSLSICKRSDFCVMLNKVMDQERNSVGWQNLIHATAEQRAEALLKTIGRWEDESE